MKQVPGFTARSFGVVAIALLLATTMTYAKTASPFDVKTVFFNSFEVKAEKNIVNITWVATEYNNKSFELQHSDNGTDWVDVALIPSKRSPESLETYTYKYNNNMPGKHYYRLRHVDIDGHRTGYSAVRMVTIKNEELDIAVWPNPAISEIRIINNSNERRFETRAQIYDLSGKMLIEKKLQAGVNTIPVSDFIPGTYLVRVNNENGLNFSQKIIKQ